MLQPLSQPLPAIALPKQSAMAPETGDVRVSGDFSGLIEQLASQPPAKHDGNQALQDAGRNRVDSGKILPDGKRLPDGEAADQEAIAEAAIVVSANAEKPDPAFLAIAPQMPHTMSVATPSAAPAAENMASGRSQPLMLQPLPIPAQVKADPVSRANLGSRVAPAGGIATGPDMQPASSPLRDTAAPAFMVQINAAPGEPGMTTQPDKPLSADRMMALPASPQLAHPVVSQSRNIGVAPATGEVLASIRAIDLSPEQRRIAAQARLLDDAPDVPDIASAWEAARPSQDLPMPGNPLLADGRLAHEPLSGQSSVSAQRTSAVLDFAQLVDRLVEAREAAAPQLVRTAVQHAEFGRISLQFSSLPDHLRVTMASADPDFVPAAQAAAALAAAPAGQDTEAVRAGPQPQQHAMSGAATQGMMSGDTSARSGDAGRHGAGEDNPAPSNAGRRREQSEGDSARQPLGRKGIYA